MQNIMKKALAYVFGIISGISIYSCSNSNKSKIDNKELQIFQNLEKTPVGVKLQSGSRREAQSKHLCVSGFVSTGM
jgi:hypothetical protein